MAKYLVIVESPAKVKTIKKFLGKNYEVLASNGHVRDLPKSQIGFDAEHDFEPKYITIRGKGDVLAALRREVKKADKIYLATDPDREGEAISWHLSQALKLEGKNVSRISFNEITQAAVKTSLKNPREIDMNLVDAQQARRMLDRIVGYRISPLIWSKVKRGLSAGRVQSVALRIVCDRENEINAFIPEEYWSVDVSLNVEGEKKPISAKLTQVGGNKFAASNKEEVDRILKNLENAKYQISSVKKGERTRKSPLPFTTSTLQQEASKVLNFPISKTMRIAQQLYEGVEVKGYGTVGLITYLRTDSVRISDEAKENAQAFIESVYGEKYLLDGVKKVKNSSNAQDAHEAIRPSDINRTPSVVKDSLSRDQFRLYQLIWKRFTASQMANAIYETTSVSISAADCEFRLSSQRPVFDGFMSVYVDSEEEEEKTNTLSNALSEASELSLVELMPQQHFTQPPAHFTEASLVKTLEELGIGRPSTYAPTISTILARRYIIKENKNLYVTEIGEAVNNIMTNSFSTIVDENFTANMETLLDGVADGTVAWKTIIANFYPDLEAAVKKAEEDLEKIEIADEVSEEVCDICGRNMVIKYGPYGKFLACPGFPECRNTKPYFEKIGVACPKCGKDIVIKMSKKGRKFYGCIDNRTEGDSDALICDFMSWSRPVNDKCPRCGSYMVEKGNKLACSKEECGYVAEK